MTDMLDTRIKQWRRELALKHGLLTRELDELEDHLRTDVAEHTDQVEDAETDEHFTQAANRIGNPNQLACELRAIRRRSYRSMAFGWIVIFGMLMLSPAALHANYSPYYNGLQLFWDTNAVLLAIGFVFGGLTLTYRPRQIIMAIKLGAGRVPPADLDELIEAKGVLRRGRQLAWASVPMGLVIGAVCNLTNMVDPALLGRSLSLFVLGTLTAILIAELFFASQIQFLQDRREQIENASLV